MLDIRDWRPELGGFGKLHDLFGVNIGSTNRYVDILEHPDVSW